MEWDSKSCTWNGVSKLEVEDNSYHHHLATLAGSQLSTEQMSCSDSSISIKWVIGPIEEHLTGPAQMGQGV